MANDESDDSAPLESAFKDEPSVLMSDEPTVELIVRARGGDDRALEALLQRCLPPLKRWAHGKLPPVARGHIDTGDLVQEAALNALRRLHAFEPRHVGAMQAFLRASVINRIRDELRRVGRRPAPAELPEDLASTDTSPDELAIREQDYQRYRAALRQLRTRDREIVVARIEAQWSAREIAEWFGFHTPDAARMAMTRAMRRLIALLGEEHAGLQ
jgi:RNA polymerase sigma-70 factor (ECF subfamily)